MSTIIAISKDRDIKNNEQSKDTGPSVKYQVHC
jgi:hypothetical protein